MGVLGVGEEGECRVGSYESPLWSRLSIKAHHSDRDEGPALKVACQYQRVGLT